MSGAERRASWRVAGLAVFAVLGTVAVVVAALFVGAAFLFSRA